MKPAFEDTLPVSQAPTTVPGAVTKPPFEDTMPADGQSQGMNMTPGNIMKALPYVSNALKTPWQKTQDLFPRAAGAGAEKLGEMGVNPTVAAGAMLPVAMAPQLLSSGTALKSIFTSPEPLAQAIRSTPKDLSPAFQAADEAAGVTSKLPEQRGTMLRFPEPEGAAMGPKPLFKAQTLPSVPPASYPKDPNTLINAIRDRVDQFGNKLSPQELSDSKSLLSNLMNTGKIDFASKQGATASKLMQDVTDLHNQAVPGREELNQVYSYAKTIHPEMGDWIVNGLKRYGKWAIMGALFKGGGEAIGKMGESFSGGNH